ncbi:MAG: DUF4097 domain-containing protein [Clostridia bacterium]|nr:DUF4097 domain-containing protein [Clostridia bacterium]
MKGFVKVIIAGAVIIGIGIAVLLIALGLNGWSFKPNFTQEEFASTEENTALDIELAAGELKIEYHDGDKVEISYPVASGYKTEISEKDGKLSFEGNKHRWYTFTWGVTIPQTVIKIPRDKIKDVEIEVNAGTVSLAEGAFENVKIKVNAGTVTTGEITNCNRFELNMNAGAVNVASVQCSEFSLKLNAGAAKIQRVDSAESEIKVNAGSANLKFAGAIDDYSATVNKSAGSCDGLYNRTGGDKNITVKVNAGSVNVSFEK